MISKLKQILKNYKKNKSFINVADFLKYCNFLIIISYKGTGKSYSAYKYLAERYLHHGEQFAIIRNTEIERENSKVEDSLLSILNEQRPEGYTFKARRGGIYKTLEDVHNDRGELIGLTPTMNKSYNMSSQNALNKCVNILYDEFINPDFNKKNLFSDFLKLVHTLTRKNIPKIILLGNKHSANNDILNELGVEFDWENNTEQIITRERMHLIALYLDKWEISEMNKANSYIEALSEFSPSMRNFSSGNIGNNNLYGVISWAYNELYKAFTPLFKYDLNGTRYAVGTILKDNEPITYIKQMDFSHEFKDCAKIYCYNPTDKLPDNIYINDVEDLSSVEYLINQYSKGRLYFSSAYAREDFKLLLAKLKIILTLNKKGTA